MKFYWIILILSIFVMIILLNADQSCDFYKHGGHHSGENREREDRENREREDRERREERELKEQEPRTIFTEKEIADLQGASVGGKMNCTVCVPCLQPVKACHSLCRLCNSMCQPSACNIRPTEKPNILNSITDTRLRKEGPSNE